MSYNTVLVLRSVITLGAACGVIGTFLLLRKRSLVADALSHAALPGVAAGFLLAVWLGQDARSFAVLLPAAAIAGALGVATIHALTTLPRVKEEAAIGVVLSVFFAAGIVLLGVVQRMPDGQKAGLNQFIFGQAATLTAADSRLMTIIAAVVLVTAAVCFKELRLACFDSAFARTLGFSRLALDGLLMSMVTALVVIGLHAVGALLMVALLILPAAAARFWTDRLGVMTLIAAVLGASGASGGVMASAWAGNVPTGPAIVMACGALFAASMMLAPQRGLLLEAMRRWTLSRRIARQHLLRAMYEQGEVAGDHAVPIATSDLRERRRWSGATVSRLLSRAVRRGEVVRIAGGHALTEPGRKAAQRIVRTHRLWEHYLTTQADIAPTHVDRAADEIEHVLGEQLVMELERTLREQEAIQPGTAVPQSPHNLDMHRRDDEDAEERA